MTGYGFSIPVHTFWPVDLLEPLFYSCPIVSAACPPTPFHSILVYTLLESTYEAPLQQPHCTYPVANMLNKQAFEHAYMEIKASTRRGSAP